MVGTRSTWRTGVSITTPRRRRCSDVRRRSRRRSAGRAASIVREQAVRQLAVIAEALAVIGGDDDERRSRLRGERVEQRTERGVGPRHLAQVRIGRDTARATRPAVDTARADRSTCTNANHLPGCCRIHVERGTHDLVGAAVGQDEVDLRSDLADLVVVDVEARREAESSVERKAADEPAGGEAERLESCRDGRLVSARDDSPCCRGRRARTGSVR